MALFCNFDSNVATTVAFAEVNFGEVDISPKSTFFSCSRQKSFFTVIVSTQGNIVYARGVQPVARGKVLSGPREFSEMTNIINLIAT